MEDPKKQFLATIKQANNILVTVKTGPSIDGLAACIALTLMLNELGKHATAVFSGDVPSVMDFLEPEKTLEKNADSLQDFIISLDKAKADKLRYKVEDTVVKIFITPYRTSLSAKDLEFGQGDFNVDVIVALGVHSQDDLDQAITAHGRILHDATVVSINTVPGVADDLGSINWIDEKASSLSELLALAADDLAGDKKDLIDGQIATALLTGIVAETERFGNAKTTPETMQAAAKLLTAGANQELVATQLAPKEPAAPAPSAEPAPEADGDKTADDATADSPASEPEPADAAEQESAKDPGALSIDHHDEPGPQAAPDEPQDPPVEPSAEAPVETPAAPGGTDTPAPDAPADVVEPVVQPPDSPAPADTPSEPAADVQPEETVVHRERRIEPLAGAAAADRRHDQVASDDFALGLAGIAAADPTAVPPAYDLNRISIPASVPVAPADQPVWPALPNAPYAPPAPPQPQPPVLPQADAEEVAALAMLKQHQSIDSERLTIQPLRDQNNFLGQPPLHDKKRLGADPHQGPVDDSLDATKFAITPPSHGGTLTAAHDQSDIDPSTDPLSNNLAHPRAMLSHDGPSAQAAQDARDVQDAKPDRSAAPGLLDGVVDRPDADTGTDSPAAGIPPVTPAKAAPAYDGTPVGTTPAAAEQPVPAEPVSAAPTHEEPPAPEPIAHEPSEPEPAPEPDTPAEPVAETPPNTDTGTEAQPALEAAPAPADEPAEVSVPAEAGKAEEPAKDDAGSSDKHDEGEVPPLIEALPADPEPETPPVAEAEPAQADTHDDTAKSGAAADTTDITQSLLEAQMADPEPAAKEAPHEEHADVAADKGHSDEPPKPMEAALASPDELVVSHEDEHTEPAETAKPKQEGPAPKLEAAVDQPEPAAAAK